MKIISIEGLEISGFGGKVWVVAVTVFNYSNGEGIVIPFAFDTPEDSEDAVKHFETIAKLQGGEIMDGNESPFSSN